MPKPALRWCRLHAVLILFRRRLRFIFSAARHKGHDDGGQERRIPQHHHGGRQQSPPDRRPVRAGGGYAKRHDHRLYLAQEAVEYAKANPVALAILDIELGSASGLDLCHTLQEINPRTNVVYLTAYPDYSLDVWDTEACGFMVKPLTSDGIRKQLGKLRYPLPMGGTDE